MKSPFKFLDSYTREDRAIFFGRDQEITELYRRVFESKILLVYGVSGTGKSSLINCGLASRFDDSDWLPVNVRRGNNIIDSLNDAFNKQAIRPLKKNFSVSEKLQSIYLDHFKPVYLIFDQFEELFIFGSADEKTGFIKLIKEVVKSETQCRVLFIIREEFLAGITEFEFDLPEIFSNRFRVEKMKRANAIHAVEGPCKVHDIEIEPGFAEELIDKLCPAGNEIELTFLQIYLDRIFRVAVDVAHPTTGETQFKSGNYPPSQGGKEGGLVFTKSLLSKAGSVSDLLGQFLEEQIGEMEDPNTATSILKSFVSAQGTKRQMKEAELLDSIGTFGTVISESELLIYLSKLVDLRILRERDEADHFELRHDALAAKIYEKFTLLEKELLEVRLFIENARLAFNTRKTYLTQDDLNYLSTYEKRLFLPAILSKFVEDSKEKLHSQQRALRRLTSLVAVVFLFIVAAGVRYYLNKKSSTDTMELTTLALLQEKVDPLTSINIAFRIREKDSLSTVVQGIILNSFYKLLQKGLETGDTAIPKVLLPKEVPVRGSIISMRMNKARDHLFGWTDSKEVFTCGISDSIVQSFVVDYEISIVEMSEDYRYFAVIFKNSKGVVYTSDGKKLFAFETTINHLMNNRLVRFFPSGKYFMAAVKDNNALIYDSTGAILFDLTGHTGRVNSLDISPDGRFVATASCDKTVLVWNYNHKTRLFSPYDTLVRYIDLSFAYSHPDSLIGPTDTIWSCEFNSSGRYILTASADSMLNIWSLNGVLRNVSFMFAKNSVQGTHMYWPLWDPRLVLSYININRSGLKDYYLNGYYKKVYDATFAAGDKAVIASNYSYNDTLAGISYPLFRTRVLYFDGFFPITQNADITNPYVLTAQNQTISRQIQSIELLDVSNDCQLFADVPYKMENIRLIAEDGYHILDIPGSFPSFTRGDNSLLYLYKKTLRFLPINLKEISQIVLEKQIFGDPETGEVIWKVL